MQVRVGASRDRCEKGRGWGRVCCGYDGRGKAGEEEEAILWTATLAMVLSDQGRRNDALAMGERVLEFRRRVLPENHPSIGEGDAWYWIAYF